METNIALSGKQIDYALAEHAEVIRTAGRAMIENVLEIGRHLTEAKKLCEPRRWLAWLEREFRWTRQTADNLMNVYAMAECKRVCTFPDLPLRSLYLLARPSTPEAVREEVLERAASGERITHEQVKQEITEAKQTHQRPPQSPSPDPTAKPRRIDWDQINAAMKIIRGMSPDTFEQFDKHYRKVPIPF